MPVDEPKEEKEDEKKEEETSAEDEAEPAQQTLEEQLAIADEAEANLGPIPKKPVVKELKAFMDPNVKKASKKSCTSCSSRQA